MEVWKVAIALSMTSNHASVLGALTSHLLGVHGTVGKLTGGFDRLKLAIGGALGVTAGVALIDTMVKVIEKTKDYSDELVKLKQLGGDMLPAVASGAMSKRAFDIAQRVPMTVTDILKIPATTYSILGQEDSMKVWEPLAQFSWVMQNQKDYHGDPGADLQKLIRASELTGRLTDPNTHKAAVGELSRFLDLSTKIISATHGLVNPNTLLGMAQQGGFTMRGLSDEGFMTQAMMAQAMGGPRAGTAYMSLWQQMAGGQMLTRTAQGMQDVGLIKPGEWYSDHGHVIMSNEASSRLTQLIGKDPLDMAAKLVEHFKQAGVTDPLQQMRMVMRAFGRQTTERYSAEEVTNFHQMLAERERLKQGLGVGASFGLINNESVSANMVALSNAWNNLLTAVAGPNSENVISLLKTLTAGINSMTAAVNRMDPETLKNIGYGLGILAGAMLGAGVVALLAAIGTGGWLIGGIIALGGAIYAWGDKIKGGLDTMRDFFLNLQQRVLGSIAPMGDAIYNALKAIWDRITALFGGALGPVSQLFGGVSEAVSNAMKGALDRLPGMTAGLMDGVSNVFTNLQSRVLGSISSMGDAIYNALKGIWDKITAIFGGGKGGAGTDQFKKDLDDANKKYVPMRFEPGNNAPKAQPISLSLNVDGRTLAQVIAEQLMLGGNYQTESAAPNGGAAYGA